MTENAYFLINKHYTF